MSTIILLLEDDMIEIELNDEDELCAIAEEMEPSELPLDIKDMFSEEEIEFLINM